MKKEITFKPTEENGKKLKILSDVLGMSVSDVINTCINSVKLPDNLEDLSSIEVFQRLVEANFR